VNDDESLLCIGRRVTCIGSAIEIIPAFLFEQYNHGTGHQRRSDKINVITIYNKKRFLLATFVSAVTK
jgi:ribose 5-phosphate isomerase RpiB